MPTDPSMRFEALIADGLAAIDEEKDNALYFTDTLIAARSLFDRAAAWTGSSLRVCFWNGDSKMQRAVVDSASRWNGVAGISLDFTDKPPNIRQCKTSEDGDIRVSLVAKAGSAPYRSDQARWGNWSLVGRQSEFQPPGSPAGTRYAVTLNLPQVDLDFKAGDLTSAHFTIGHEFGHALGLLHEFQAAICKGWIDIKQMADDQGWVGDAASYSLDSLPDIADKFKISLGVAGPYDVDSIMQYNFKAKYYVSKPGQTNPCRRKENVSIPSKADIATLVAIYGPRAPHAVQAASSPGIKTKTPPDLRTALLKAQKTAAGMNPGMSGAINRVVDKLRRLDDFVAGR